MTRLKHAYYGHTITDQFLRYHHHCLSLRGPVVRLNAVIDEVRDDVDHQGVIHYHLLLSQVHVTQIVGAEPALVKERMFAAIRRGESMGILEPIVGLTTGEPIEIQGEYLDINQAYTAIGNRQDPVIHFTHHPVGYVLYEGKRYE